MHSVRIQPPHCLLLMSHQNPIFGWRLALLALLMVPTARLTAQDDDERPRYYTGVLAEYRDADGQSVNRLDDLLSRRFDERDPRLASGRIEARWHGRLFAAAPGRYRLRVHAAAGGDGENGGRIKIELLGEVLLDQPLCADVGWLETAVVDLPFGRHPLRVSYVGQNNAAKPGKIALYWEGPKFSLEPIGAQFLLHDGDEHSVDASRRGAELVRGLRCAACHQIPGEREKLASPDLRQLDGNIYPSWLRDWLLEEGAQHSERLRRMPQFVWNPGDVADVVAALAMDSPQRIEPPADKKSRELRQAGEQLVHQTGCLACHSLNGAGGSDVYGGGDLSRIAAKRPAAFFRKWLRDPDALNEDHRMPVFALTSKEQSQIAAYLASLGAPDEAYQPPATASAQRGVQLLASRGCVQCHRIAGARAADPPARSRLHAQSDWSASCLGEPAKNRPGYQLSDEDAGAVRLYIDQITRASPREHAANGLQLMREHNCVACHQRNGELGLAPKLTDIVAAHPEWAPRLPAMKPPSLNSVGDKLKDAALKEAIAEAPRRRAWLDVRMPKFRLTDEQLSAIVEHLVQEDRIPADAPVAEESRLAASKLQRVAGRRLVTADGFGCTSCHAVGKVKPSRAPINAAGPDLLMLGERIRKPWFDRWVRNPARIVPRMEMPSVQTPVRGLLEGHLDDQLDAVWLVLNTKGFVPPEPNPVRIVRRHNLSDEPERAAVVTDVLHLGDQVLVKPLLVGLTNRHNLLYDLETARVRGWWTGDTARQHTKGKTWLWRPGAPNLLEDDGSVPELQLTTVDESGARQAWKLVRRGQFFTEFEWLEFQGPSVRFAYRLLYSNGEGKEHGEDQSVWVTETVTPMDAHEPLGRKTGSAAGLRRQMTLNGPPGAELLLTPVGEPQPRSEGNVFLVPGGRVRVRAAGSRMEQGRLIVPLGDLHEQGEAVVEMEFQATTPADQFFPRTIEAEPRSPTQLAVAPGFAATRLPFEMEMMPTAMAWRPGGQLAVASLKGRVWQAVDTNQDGLEDEASPLADDLAAPFGVAIPSAGPSHSVDVVGKYALLRLTDADNDGWAERWERLASGWGHTADYHDWTIGLPQDEHGRYYLATACQQDNRSAAAAKWRGVVMQLEPNSSDRLEGGRKHPPYRIQPLTAGHRFPIGIARNREGQLFVTDNQGNYNPFNELNHVRAGKRYGFINKLDRKPDFKPPLTKPAINIPHPWTRSVNGICFLETPSGLSAPVFGPYEGHLVGCEYDTRRLIRMSLEEVDGVLQGAAYPLTRQESDAEPLLGPLCAAISPRGDLYVGCIRDSGWGGSNNVGTVVQLRPQVDALPPGIAEIRVTSDGFLIQLQGAAEDVDWARAAFPESYALSSYRRVSTPAYGGNDVDRREETVVAVEVNAQQRQVRLRLKSLRLGHVYDFQIQNLAKDSGPFFPAEAYYTVHRAR